MTTSARRIATILAGDHGGPSVMVQELRKFRTPAASKFKAANDNQPGRTTRMTAYNGGCSTTSGTIPITLPHVSIVDGPVLQVAA